MSDSLIDLVELFVHRRRTLGSADVSWRPPCLFDYLIFSTQHPQLSSMSQSPICSILHFPAIAFPVDDGPDVLSDGPARHGSAARAFCVRRRTGAGLTNRAATPCWSSTSIRSPHRTAAWSAVWICPNVGDELHHFGWNACSAALCPYAPHPHLERRYLVVPGLRSSRIHIIDTKPDPQKLEIVKIIEPEEVFARTGYSRPAYGPLWSGRHLRQRPGRPGRGRSRRNIYTRSLGF